MNLLIIENSDILLKISLDISYVHISYVHIYYAEIRMMSCSIHTHCLI